MSTASRLRQVTPKPPAHRKKRQPYKPSPFDVTGFQDREHKALVKANTNERQAKAGDKGRSLPRAAQDAKRRVKNWPAWIRDGFESEIHYAVHHNKAGLIAALRSGDAHHPLLATALEANRLGLIKV